MVDPQLLASIPLFESLDDFDLRKIGAWFEPREASEGIELVGEGAPGYSFFVIASGSAEVRSGDVSIAELGPGDFFGEAAIVGGRGRRNASVVTTSASQVLVMFGTEFRRLQQSFPEVTTQIETAARERLAAEQS